MPLKLICCVSLPPATISSVPIYDFAKANEEFAKKATDHYYSCCGKSICGGCIYSFRKSENDDYCPFCKAEISGKTEKVEELMKRAETNDASVMNVLGSWYYHGEGGVQQDQVKAMELWTQAANLGSSHAHFCLGVAYRQRGDLKKAKFHWEAAAMAGIDVARFNIGGSEYSSGNIERAIKHWTIGASAGDYMAMHNLRAFFEKGVVSRESIDSTLTAYNYSCAEMRSEARDACIRLSIDRN
jgi:TPR repeat protein